MAFNSSKQKIKIEPESIWKYIMFGCLFVTILIFAKAYYFCHNPDSESLCQLQYKDFEIILYAIILFGVIRILFFLYGKPLIGKYLIDKSQYSSDEQYKLKSEIFSKWILDICQYSFLAVFEYYILKDSDFLPKLLLGKGDESNTFADYGVAKFVPYQREFYLISLGIHAVSLIYQLSGLGHNKKHYEFMLHHYMALFLILFSYINNLMRIGLLVLITHDIGDVVLSFGRLIIELKYNIFKKIKTPIAAICVFLWIYTRNFAFPFLVIKESVFFTILCFNTKIQKLENIKFPVLYLTSMLIMLAIMHVYWTAQVLKIGVNLIIKKKQTSVYYERPNIQTTSLSKNEEESISLQQVKQ